MVKELEALSVLFRQLAAADRHGVPAQEVAALLAQDPQWGRRARRLLERLADALRTRPLVSALDVLPGLVGPETLQLVRAAQDRQLLPVVLDTLADDFRQRAGDARFVRVGMTWPLWVSGVSITVLFTLATHVLPAFDQAYAEFNAALPVESSLLVAISTLIVRWSWLWAPLLAVLVIAIWRGLLPPWLDRPVNAAWGRLGFVRRHATSRFTLRLLRWLRLAGVNAAVQADALAHLRASTALPALRRAAGQLEDALRRGASPAAALDEAAELPRRLALLARLGERFGDPAAALDQLDELAQAEAQAAAVHYEQGCLLMLYAVLGLTAVAAISAVYLPIFKFGSIV